MKMRINISIGCFLFAMACMILLTSCKPKPIEGQAFSSSEHGNAPIGDVEVSLVNQKDIDDFIDQRNTSLKANFDALVSALKIQKAQTTNLESDLKVAMIAEEYYRHGGYKTNQDYVDLESEYEDLDRTNKILSAAIQTLRERNRQFPVIFLSAGEGQQARQQEQINNQAIAADQDRLRDIRQQQQTIDHKMDAMRYNSADSPVNDLRSKISDSIQSESNAREKLRTFLKQFDFFDGLNIPQSGATTSDMGGKFSIVPTAPNQKVFARWKDRTKKSNFYWVQDLPKQKDFKIVLTLRNSFSPSFLNEPDVSELASQLDGQTP